MVGLSILALVSFPPRNPIPTTTLIFGSDRSSRVKTFDLTSRNNEVYQCLPLVQADMAKMCLYNESYISSLLRSNNKHIFDKENFDTLSKLLQSNPDAGFIDIGANLGLYTIFVSKLYQRRVVAVEPFPPVIKRFQKSLQINGLTDYVTLITNPISDSRKTKFFHLQKGNVGQNKLATAYEKSNKPMLRVETIVMDDIVRFIPFKSAIMKIDVEGEESRAFSEASELITRIDVVAILMEWRHVKLRQDGNSVQLMSKFLYLMTTNDYLPYSMTQQPLSYGSWDKWPIDVVFKKRSISF